MTRNPPFFWAFQPEQIPTQAERSVRPVRQKSEGGPIDLDGNMEKSHLFQEGNSHLSNGGFSTFPTFVY